VKKTKSLDIIVAGENFGTGSSREEAVKVFKNLGIKAVIAKSFARIYFRNLINSGMPAIKLKWQDANFKNGDAIKIDLNSGNIINQTQKLSLKFPKLPKFIMEVLEEGGIIKRLKKKFD
jgi:3-isopropylmalate/(R)-2-methylmalate dehydratase small subunit